MYNGFEPPKIGDTWNLISVGEELSGSFTSIAAAWLPSDLSLVIDYEPQGVVARIAERPLGDFNGDGRVDAADYVLWRKSPSQYGGNPDGYNAWRANYGTGSSSASAVANSAVPEPSTILLSALALCGLLTRRRA